MPAVAKQATHAFFFTVSHEICGTHETAFSLVQNTSKQKAREVLLFSVLLPLHSAVCDYSCLAIHLANTLLQFTMHRILKRMMKPYDQLVKVSCSGTSHITYIARIRHRAKKIISVYFLFPTHRNISQIERSLKIARDCLSNCTVCTACI